LYWNETVDWRHKRIKITVVVGIVWNHRLDVTKEHMEDINFDIEIKAKDSRGSVWIRHSTGVESFVGSKVPVWI